MNPLATLNAAQRSNAAYVMDRTAATAAFAALDMTLVDQYRNATHQGVISRDAKGLWYLSIAGTRFSQGGNVDILDDIWLAPSKAPKGGVVPAGVNQGMQDFWNWVLKTIPAGMTINIEGHSLGAERALLTPIYLAPERIGDLYAFEPPMCGTQEYWDAYGPALSRAVQTVCGADVFYGWPPRQGYVHGAMGITLFLQEQQIEIIQPAAWPGGDSQADHAITEVIARLQASITNNTFPHV